MEDTVKGLLNSDLLILVGVLLGTMLLKDIINGFVSGLLFVMNKNFNIGDNIVLDGKDGVIINIGIRQTIFELDGVWVYIYNSKISSLKLGKRVRKKL